MLVWLFVCSLTVYVSTIIKLNKLFEFLFPLQTEILELATSAGCMDCDLSAFRDPY